MVRKYKKKKVKELSQEDMKKAIHEVMNKKRTLRAAAKKYSINLSTLYYRIVRVKEYALSEDKDNGPYKRRVFTPDEEAILSRYFVSYSNLNYGISYTQMRMLAYVYAKSLDRQVPANWETDNRAGRDWLTNFLNRVNNNLSVVKADLNNPTPALVEADFFCTTFERALQADEITANRIYNLCEIEVSLDVPDQNEEQVEAQSLSVTMCAVANAAADLVPPTFVFPLNTMDPTLLPYTPPGTLGMANLPSGGVLTVDHFIPLLKHLQKHSKCSKDYPIILLLDNIVSQCTCTMDITAYCVDNGIRLMSFPPNWAKSKQPLNSNVMDSFKTIFESNKEEIHSGGPSLLHDLTSLISSSYITAFTKKNIAHGFKKSHIWPFCKQALRDSTLKTEQLESEQPEEIDFPRGDKEQQIGLEKDLLRVKWRTRKLDSSTHNPDNQYVIVICEDENSECESLKIKPC